MGFREKIEHTSTLLTGAILGATAMYMLDAQQGRRRRALARDKMVRALNRLGREARRQARNMGKRSFGQVAELRSSLRDRGGVDDVKLVERVRAQLGHAVSHPGSLEIRATDGHVTVSGPVLRHEIDQICDRLNKTRGVSDFELRVEAHDSAEGVPGLQGHSRRERIA